MHSAFIRAFFALDLPPEFKDYLGSVQSGLRRHLQQQLTPRSFRWVKPHHVHLTLRFLGQLDQATIAQLLHEVGAELAGLPSFYLRWGALEWFPSRVHPQVLSVHALPHAPLVELAQAVGRGVVRCGYAREDRPFRPHLTVARLSGLRNPAVDLAPFFSGEDLPEVFVKEVVLFSSEPAHGEAHYTRLASLKLEDL